MKQNDNVGVTPDGDASDAATITMLDSKAGLPPPK